MKDKNQTGWLIAGGVAVCTVVAVARFAPFFTRGHLRPQVAVDETNPTAFSKPEPKQDLRSAGATDDPLETQVGPTIATPRAPRVPNSVRKDAVRPAPKAASVAPAQVSQPLVTNKPIPEPLARAALSFVGMDAEAEIVWASTINDPSVDPDTRKNLIEDLNEDGFPDPKHISPDDLPLILKRIELIENHAPLSMDEVNAAAFQEAYKDLLNMAEKAARG